MFKFVGFTQDDMKIGNCCQFDIQDYISYCIFNPKLKYYIKLGNFIYRVTQFDKIERSPAYIIKVPDFLLNNRGLISDLELSELQIFAYDELNDQTDVSIDYIQYIEIDIDVISRPKPVPEQLIFMQGFIDQIKYLFRDEFIANNQKYVYLTDSMNTLLITVHHNYNGIIRLTEDPIIKIRSDKSHIITPEENKNYYMINMKEIKNGYIDPEFIQMIKNEMLSLIIDPVIVQKHVMKEISRILITSKNHDLDAFISQFCKYLNRYEPYCMDFGNITGYMENSYVDNKINAFGSLFSCDNCSEKCMHHNPEDKCKFILDAVPYTDTIILKNTQMCDPHTQTKIFDILKNVVPDVLFIFVCTEPDEIKYMIESNIFDTRIHIGRPIDDNKYLVKVTKYNDLN